MHILLPTTIAPPAAAAGSPFRSSGPVWSQRAASHLSTVLTERKTKYRPAIWSYNAVEHHKRLHKSSVMPPAFFNACNPSDEELAKLKKLLK